MRWHPRAIVQWVIDLPVQTMIPWVKERVVKDYAPIVDSILGAFERHIPQDNKDDLWDAISYRCMSSTLPLLASAFTTVPDVSACVATLPKVDLMSVTREDELERGLEELRKNHACVVKFGKIQGRRYRVAMQIIRLFQIEGAEVGWIPPS